MSRATESNEYQTQKLWEALREPKRLNTLEDNNLELDNIPPTDIYFSVKVIGPTHVANSVQLTFNTPDTVRLSLKCGDNNITIPEMGYDDSVGGGIYFDCYFAEDKKGTYDKSVNQILRELIRISQWSSSDVYDDKKYSDLNLLDSLNMLIKIERERKLIRKQFVANMMTAEDNINDLIRQIVSQTIRDDQTNEEFLLMAVNGVSIFENSFNVAIITQVSL